MFSAAVRRSVVAGARPLPVGPLALCSRELRGQRAGDRRAGRGDAMKRAIGSVVLGLSACGYPLTQLAIRRWGCGSGRGGVRVRRAGHPRRFDGGQRRPGQAAQVSGRAAAPVTGGRRCGLAGRVASAAARAIGCPAGSSSRGMRCRDRAPSGRRHVVRGAYHQVRDLPSPGSGSARHAGLMRARRGQAHPGQGRCGVPSRARISAPTSALASQLADRRPARPGERAGCGMLTLAALAA